MAGVPWVQGSMFVTHATTLLRRYEKALLIPRHPDWAASFRSRLLEANRLQTWRSPPKSMACKRLDHPWAPGSAEHLMAATMMHVTDEPGPIDKGYSSLHSFHGYLIALASILLLCLADYIITDRRAPACQSIYFNQRNNSIAATLLTFSPSPRIFRLSHDCIALPLSNHFQIQCATTRKCSTNALMSATSSKHGVPNTNKPM